MSIETLFSEQAFARGEQVSEPLRSVIDGQPLLGRTTSVINRALDDALLYSLFDTNISNPYWEELDFDLYVTVCRQAIEENESPYPPLERA